VKLRLASKVAPAPEPEPAPTKLKLNRRVLPKDRNPFSNNGRKPGSKPKIKLRKSPLPKRDPNVPITISVTKVQTGDVLITSSGKERMIDKVENWGWRVVIYFNGYGHYYRADSYVPVLRQP
jgi:hypothetical protein